MTEREFCEQCDVAIGLHEGVGPEACDAAQARANVINLFWGVGAR